jgi:hypothetical protein
MPISLSLANKCKRQLTGCMSSRHFTLDESMTYGKATCLLAYTSATASCGGTSSGPYSIVVRCQESCPGFIIPESLALDLFGGELVQSSNVCHALTTYSTALRTHRKTTMRSSCHSPLHGIAVNEGLGGQVRSQGGYIHNIMLAKRSPVLGRLQL